MYIDPEKSDSLKSLNFVFIFKHCFAINTSTGIKLAKQMTIISQILSSKNYKKGQSKLYSQYFSWALSFT